MDPSSGREGNSGRNRVRGTKNAFESALQRRRGFVYSPAEITSVSAKSTLVAGKKDEIEISSADPRKILAVFVLREALASSYTAGSKPVFRTYVLYSKISEPGAKAQLLENWDGLLVGDSSLSLLSD